MRNPKKKSPKLKKDRKDKLRQSKERCHPSKDKMEFLLLNSRPNSQAWT
jgi:hypothetical protein